MVDGEWLALSVAVGEACRRDSVNGGWWMVDRDAYFLGGKGLASLSPTATNDRPL